MGGTVNNPSVAVVGATLNLGADATDPARFRIAGASTVNGTVKSGQELRLTSFSSPSAPNLTLSSTGTLTNNGAFEAVIHRTRHVFYAGRIR
ncbi:MAG: hypothetical protein ACRDJI_08815 [Actinomycetota bacterium]